VNAYNDSVVAFVEKYFSTLQTFEPSEEYFNNIKDSQFQLFLNSLY